MFGKILGGAGAGAGAGALGGPVGAGIGAAVGGLGGLLAGGDDSEEQRKAALAALSQKYAASMGSPSGGVQYAPPAQSSGPSTLETLGDAAASGLSAFGTAKAADAGKANALKKEAGLSLTADDKSGAEVPWYAQAARGYLGGR